MPISAKRSEFNCKLDHACLSFVGVHQMAPPLTEVADIQLQLTTCQTRKDERLSWPGWLTYSGRFTHVSGHPSAIQVERRTGKFAGQRLTFYRCATQEEEQAEKEKKRIQAMK